MPITSAIQHQSKTTIVYTRYFYSSNGDGHIYNEGSEYFPMHHAPEGIVVDDKTDFSIGQIKNDEIFRVYRGFLFFDTSDLPDNCEILSATLSLYGKNDYAFVFMTLNVVNGNPLTYPHHPLQSGDYYYGNYWCQVGGWMNCDYWTDEGYNDIILNSLGRSWINKGSGALTKFCLRTSLDIAWIEPETSEFVKAYTSEKGIGYRPRLRVTYTAEDIQMTGVTDI